jgi:hypothetical protein
MTKPQLLQEYFTDISINGSFWDFSYNNLNYIISDYILSNLLFYGSSDNWKSDIIERAKVIESIYIIRDYDMIGSKFKTFEKLNFDRVERINDVFRCVKNNETEYWNSGKYYTISQKPEGENYNKIFLPYFADVTEDLNIPKELKRKGLKARKYKNCQLMAQKKGGYYYFFSHTKKKELLIAMNSHTYKPKAL